MLLGRLTPVVRSFVSIPAGIFEAPFRRYTVLTLIGSAIWCFVFAGAGWAAGASWESFHHAFRFADVASARQSSRWRSGSSGGSGTGGRRRRDLRSADDAPCSLRRSPGRRHPCAAVHQGRALARPTIVASGTRRYASPCVTRCARGTRRRAIRSSPRRAEAAPTSWFVTADERAGRRPSATRGPEHRVARPRPRPHRRRPRRPRARARARSRSRDARLLRDGAGDQLGAASRVRDRHLPGAVALPRPG